MAASRASTSKKLKDEVIKAIRISNNSIERVQILVNPFTNFIDATEVLWLDLSFNAIETIDPVLVHAFPNVTAIYLHANQISKLSEIKKLALFPRLKSLSMYGNKVEEHKHYRNFVLYNIPTLTNFDKSPVTKTERQMNEVWARTYRRKLHPEEDD